MTIWKRLVGTFAAAAIMLGIIPMGMVSATVTTYYPTTWAELRNALQSSGEAKIIIPEDVIVEHTFDYRTDYIDDTKITVVGKKTIDLRGEIHFYNGLEINGLFNLDSADDELIIDGYIGKIVYHLYDSENDTLWHGDLFYLTDGKLTLGGNCFFTVDCGNIAQNSVTNRAVIGGTGGVVTVDYAFLKGNTIFGNGISFIFKNGSLEGRSSYQNVDLYMCAGTARFEGCAFHRGIGVSPDTSAAMVMAEDAVCVDMTDNTTSADNTVIVFNKPCAFVRVGFAKMEPAMPALSTNCELGQIGVGDDLEIAAWTMTQGTGLSGKQLVVFYEIDVYRDGEQVHYESMSYNNARLSYSFADAPAGKYDVFYRVLVKKNGVTLRTKTYRYVVEKTTDIAHVELSLDKSDMNSLHAVSDYAGLSDIVWYEKSKTNDTWTADPSTLRDTYTYAVEFSLLSVGGTYPFGDGYTVSVTGIGAYSGTKLKTYTVYEDVVYVGDVILANGDYLDNNGDITVEAPTGGYAHYADGVLTLNNFTIEGIGYVFSETNAYSSVIFALNDLTIELIGGEGSLTVEGECGICLYEGDVTINSGTLHITAVADAIDLTRYCRIGRIERATDVRCGYE